MQNGISQSISLYPGAGERLRCGTHGIKVGGAGKAFRSFQTGRVMRLTKMAQEWKSTLPPHPDPTCISRADRGKASPPGKGRRKK